MSVDFMCSSKIKLAVFGERKLYASWNRSYQTNNRAYFGPNGAIVDITITISSNVIGGCTTLFFYNNFVELQPFNCNRTVTTVNNIEYSKINAPFI